MKIAIVMPTRNRPRYALAAIESLLSQTGCAFEVIVSDNSSSEADVRTVAEFCRAANDPRLIYIRPPEELDMAAHWDWALEQALVCSDATHFTIHYDRKIWKPKSLRLLAATGERYPERIVTYAADTAFPAPPFFVAGQFPVSGKLYEIRSAQVVRLSSRAMIREMTYAFPLLSNCITPRAVIERVRDRFGSICRSATPDAAFTYRFCAIEERFLHLDHSLVMMYGFEHSNALGYFRVDAGGSFGDFMKLWGSRPWLDAAPIPGLGLGHNVLFHEYGLVQRIVGDGLFPPIDRNAYLRELASGLAFIPDPSVKAEMRRVIEEHGWRGEEPSAYVPRPRPLYRRLLGKAARLVGLSPRPRQAVALLLADRFGICPPDLDGYVFPTEEMTMRYLLQCPRRLRHNELLDPMQPTEVPFAP